MTGTSNSFKGIAELTVCNGCGCLTKTVGLLKPTLDKAERNNLVCGKCGHKR